MYIAGSRPLQFCGKTFAVYFKTVKNAKLLSSETFPVYSNHYYVFPCPIEITCSYLQRYLTKCKFADLSSYNLCNTSCMKIKLLNFSTQCLMFFFNFFIQHVHGRSYSPLMMLQNMPLDFSNREMRQPARCGMFTTRLQGIPLHQIL